VEDLRYDAMRGAILTCDQKLTLSQLNLPHVSYKVLSLSIIKLTYVGFRAHVKITYRIVSYQKAPSLASLSRWGNRMSREPDDTSGKSGPKDQVALHYYRTILRLRIGARLTRYRNCKFHNFARTISRHADGIILRTA